ncbi:MAG: hypothetical protein ABIK37_05395 [candidate division WOR-3 bacterium]
MRLLSRLAMLPAMLLAAVAAGASLRGEDAAARIVGSGWFVLLAGAVVLLALVAAVNAAIRRPAGRLSIIAVHLGLAVGPAGVALNQLQTSSGYLLLEAGTGSQSFFLNRNLREVRPLPFGIALDSVTELNRRGYRPAPLAWVSAGQSVSAPVAHSRPLQRGGFALLLLRRIEPGTPTEVELSLDGAEYLLLHNQHTRLADGRDVWSCSYDIGMRKLGLAVGDTLVWLASGDTLRLGSATIALGPVRLARQPGAAFAVRFARLRPLVFAGFGLTLLGAAGMLFRKETT